MGIKTALPTAELGLYSLVLSGALAYAGRGLLEASQGNSWARGQGGGTLLLLGASGLTNKQGQKLRGCRPSSGLGPGLSQVSKGGTDAEPQREERNTQTLREDWPQTHSEIQRVAEAERDPGWGSASSRGSMGV